MPTRLIRDGILESEAVLSLPVEARWLYVSVLLSADDFGLFEATPFKLARRADVRRELADRLLSMLLDADLIRLYQSDGKTYGFIPRFRQKLQTKRARCPVPPEELFADDPDMQDKVDALRESAETGALIGAFGKEWLQLRARAFERDGHACVRCGATSKLSAHHLVPKSRGGRHELGNLTTLCAGCNSWARNNEDRGNEIKRLALKTVSGQDLANIRPTSAQLPEPEPEPEEEILLPSYSVGDAPPAAEAAGPSKPAVSRSAGTARGTRLAPGWTLPPEWEAWAAQARPDVDPRLEADRFRDFWVAKPGREAVKLDWQATWRNWIRGAKAAPGRPANPAVAPISAHAGFDQRNYGRSGRL